MNHETETLTRVQNRFPNGLPEPTAFKAPLVRTVFGRGRIFNTRWAFFELAPSTQTLLARTAGAMGAGAHPEPAHTTSGTEWGYCDAALEIRCRAPSFPDPRAPRETGRDLVV